MDVELLFCVFLRQIVGVYKLYFAEEGAGRCISLVRKSLHISQENADRLEVRRRASPEVKSQFYFMPF